MIERIDHIGIVINDIEEALKVYQQLGLSLAKVQERPDQAATIAFLPIGESEIELVQPVTSDSGVVKFLQKRGEGIHHICLEVDDIEKTLADLQGKGLQLAAFFDSEWRGVGDHTVRGIWVSVWSVVGAGCRGCSPPLLVVGEIGLEPTNLTDVSRAL